MWTQILLEIFSRTNNYNSLSAPLADFSPGIGKSAPQHMKKLSAPSWGEKCATRIRTVKPSWKIHSSGVDARRSQFFFHGLAVFAFFRHHFTKAIHVKIGFGPWGWRRRWGWGRLPLAAGTVSFRDQGQRKIFFRHCYKVLLFRATRAFQATLQMVTGVVHRTVLI